MRRGLLQRGLLALTVMQLAQSVVVRGGTIDEAKRDVERLKAALEAAEMKVEDLSRATVSQGADYKESRSAPLPLENAEIEPFPTFSYTVRLPILVGYDDNAAGLSSEVPRRAGLAHRDSAFIQLSPALRITRTAHDKKTSWAFIYNLDKIFFLEQADANPLTNEFKLTHARKLTDFDGVSVDAGYSIKRTDEEGKSNQFLTALKWKHAWKPKIEGEKPRLSTLLEYSYALIEFALPNDTKVPAELDPDQVTHGVGITQEYVLRPEAGDGGKALGLSLGYAFLATDAEGAEWDAYRHRVSLGLAGSPFPPANKPMHKLQMEAKYVHDFDDYQNATRRAVPGLVFRQSANIDRVQLSLTYPIERNLVWETESAETKRRRGPVQALWTFQYSYTRNDSNLFGEDKDNHIIKAGIIADF